MKYKNANDVLPKEVLVLVQEYIQGEYIYVPVKDKHIAESPTDYKTELEKRDAHIYTKYLEGMNHKQLSQIYNLSESSIRRIIVKQRKGNIPMKDKIAQIIRNWGLENKDIKQIHNTAWQVGDDYVLKVYQSFSMLERNLKILQLLDNMDIPVGKAIATADNEQYVSFDNWFCFLSRRLPGSNIVRIGNDSKIATIMGEIIADLHMAFKKCEDVDVFWNNSLLDEMNGWVKSNFEANDWKFISKEEYEKIVSQLAMVYDNLPVQLIHRDVHFGNFLFSDGKFSGYIDFDLSQRNIRIFDLCYFLLGLLSEKEKLEIKDELWFEYVKKVFAGYGRKMKLTEAEKNAVPYVMECIELLFVSYFESINDIRCAEDAYKIFALVKKQENRIWKNLL